MSRIDELIQEYCPNGVKYNTLEELGNLYGGLTGKSKDDFKDGNARFITYMNVFSNIAVDTSRNDFVKIKSDERQRMLEKGDVLFTGSSENPNECGMSSVVVEEPAEPLYLNSFCFIFRLNDTDIFLPDFLKYLFRDTGIRKQIAKTASGVTRFNVSKKRFSKIVIPIPPLEVQKEIANILDKFTQLEAELSSELDARRQQYEHYRRQLLEFDESTMKIKLEHVADIGTGSRNGNEALPGGKYPLYVRSQDVKAINSYSYDEEAVIIPGEGGVGEIFHYVNGKYDLHQRAYRVHLKDENYSNKFLYYYMKTYFKKFILKKAVSATVTSIRKPMLLDFEIPVLPLEEQKRIVAILDTFDALVYSANSGLPAEITARHKQYQYYRTKLLTFQELPA